MKLTALLLLALLLSAQSLHLTAVDAGVARQLRDRQRIRDEAVKSFDTLAEQTREAMHMASGDEFTDDYRNVVHRLTVTEAELVENKW